MPRKALVYKKYTKDEKFNMNSLDDKTVIPHMSIQYTIMCQHISDSVTIHTTDCYWRNFL